MKILRKISRRQIMGLAAILACLAFAAYAFALPMNQVLQKGDKPVENGKCCFSWGDTVSVVEPAKVTPVVVTWSADYQSTNQSFVGLAINGHPCQVPEFHNLDSTGSLFGARAFQWVVLPSDGLIKGTNTITLCGGGARDTDTVTLGFRGLAVIISK